MAELRSAIFWVLNCPIYLLRCYTTGKKRRCISLFLLKKNKMVRILSKLLRVLSKRDRTK
ncbi:MAG: hypothetical protein IM570_02820 [Pseudanabaena sp. M179S2SP2A07QC]|nr:hypothetical protein [Pseudanabaena sp. M179S2SP2A07QC]